MLDERYHFHCVRCRPGLTIMRVSLIRLCEAVNDHNDQEHEDALITWTPENITFSDYYYERESTTALAVRAQPQYTTPYGTAKNSHSDRLITADDRKFLAEVLVKW